MPLSMMKPGAVCRIKGLLGNDEVRRHLADLGFVEGAEVTIVSDLAGSLILGIRETRVALNRDLVRRILV